MPHRNTLVPQQPSPYGLNYQTPINNRVFNPPIMLPRREERGIPQGRRSPLTGYVPPAQRIPRHAQAFDPNKIPPPYRRVPLRPDYSAPQVAPGQTERPGLRTSRTLEGDTKQITADILASFEEAENFNLEQVQAGIDTLTNFLESTNQMYSDLQTETQNVLQINPYTDQMRTDIITQSNDVINDTVQKALANASSQVTGAGYGTGGTSGTQAAGGIQADAFRAQADVLNQTALQQMGFNRDSNALRQEMLSNIVRNRVGASNELGSNIARFQANNRIDPYYGAEVLGEGYGLQLSERNREQLFEYLRSLEPTMGERFFEMIPALAAALFPSAGGGNAMAMLLSSLGMGAINQGQGQPYLY